MVGWLAWHVDGLGLCCGVEPVEILIIEITDRWCEVLLLVVFGGVFAVAGRIGSIGPRSPCGPVARRPDARGLSVPPVGGFVFVFRGKRRERTGADTHDAERASEDVFVACGVFVSC